MFRALKRCNSAGRATSCFFLQSPELCEAGELFDFVCPKKKPYVRPFPEHMARRMFRQIASGVNHMHRTGCYHRDLKLENLVVDAE
jgi:serine/threonine protein kinase